jgi:hypothetical protein
LILSLCVYYTKVQADCTGLQEAATDQPHEPFGIPTVNGFPAGRSLGTEAVLVILIFSHVDGDQLFPLFVS